LIDRREILDIANQTSLTPHVVEKDYVLGWMLAGIYAHEELAESWIFKGGTCLKKCFFETYRFSSSLYSRRVALRRVRSGLCPCHAACCR
jgi:predicted nucleotidyltransferase component of viral defense system